MKIINARIFTPDHTFQEGSFTIRDGRITEIRTGSGDSLSSSTDRSEHSKDGFFHHEGTPAFDAEAVLSEPEEILDAHGAYALPGLVDLHFHGAVGQDFCDADPEGLQKIADYEARSGILAICPATMTLPVSTLEKVFQNAAAHKSGRGADLVGINMEGPFLSKDKLGAQNPLYVIPGDAALFRHLQEVSDGLIKLVDVAPEAPGNYEFIEEISGEVRVSLAHMTAGYDTACAAFSAGAKQMTHLYNAMPGISHREPGPIIAALENGATAELIADGIHIHPAMVRFTFRTFGADKVILISDSMRACGLADGTYDLGGQSVTVMGRRAYLTEHPQTIAGSVTNLYDCMKEAIFRMGVPMAEAIRAASENPARALGIEKDYGRLAEGAYGNVLLADEDLTLLHVIQKGQVLS